METNFNEIQGNNNLEEEVKTVINKESNSVLNNNGTIEVSGNVGKEQPAIATADTEKQGVSNEEFEISDGDEQRKKRCLNQLKIYSKSQLEKMGYTIAKLKINRKINERALAAKCKSLKLTGAPITPSLVVYSQQCLDAGLEVILSDGSEITLNTPNLDKILVLVDGQHRDAAVNQLNSKLKKGEEKYENFFYFPMTQNVSVTTMLRESNVATSPWKGQDFLANLILVTPTEINVDLLLWVQNHLEECGDTSSWLWATLNRSRVYSKATIVKASHIEKNRELLEKITKKGNLEYGMDLYKTASKQLGIDLTKLKCVPDWCIGIIDDQNTIGIGLPKTVDMLKKFFESISEEQVAEMKSYKKDESSTKDQKIEAELNLLFKAFQDVQTTTDTTDK